MTNEPSPRPWRCECGPTVNAVVAANGSVVVPHTGYEANARLIVDAVNERDRLRDIVKRLSRHLANYITSESENDLLREARAAIGEDRP